MMRPSGPRRSCPAYVVSLLPFCFLVVWVVSGLSHSAEVTLAWDPNTEPELRGYNLYYGPASRNYTATIDVGNCTSYTIADLPDGQLLYFAATAYDSYGLESDYSNEVSCATQAPCNYALDPAALTVAASGGSASVRVITAAACPWSGTGDIPWITPQSETSGTGNGAIVYSILPNPESTPRSAGLTIAGLLLTVNQSGLPSFTIRASAGTGGSISPSGDVSVVSGRNQAFTISPATGYRTSTVTVDASAIAPENSYTFSNVTANHTIAVTFSEINYALTVTKTGTGSGTVTTSPSGTSFAAGTQVTLSATPDASSTFTGWSGACSGTSTICQVTMNGNTSVSAGFAVKSYTITASAGTGGTISPSGSVSANHGASQTFTISASSGYTVGGVTVDGASVGAVSTYTFSNLTGNHSIVTTFAQSTVYSISFTKTGSGTGTVTNNPAATSYAPNTYVTTAATADTSSVFNGWSGDCAGVSGPVCSGNVTRNINIGVDFKIRAFIISATAGAGGTVSPAGNSAVNYGTSRTYTITPSSWYSISNVVVDGASVGAVSSYTFDNITANHTISASFVTGSTPPSSYTLTITRTGTGTGTVTNDPEGTSFAPNTYVTTTATADPNSVFNGWSGDCAGVSGPVCSGSMTGNINIGVDFKLRTFTITATVGTGGTISPAGTSTVNYGTSKTYTIAPRTWYKISNVVVDGISIGPVTSYTFSNVMASHTIKAVFGR